MKALVTGGGGFLGRCIAGKLQERGYEVMSLSRGAYPDLEKLGVKTVRADLADRDAVTAAIKGMDVVFHTASRVGIWGPYREFYEANVIGTRNVVEACRRGGVPKLVYTSSPSVVFDGRDHEGIDETYPYPAKYLAHYPETKAIAEREVLAANGGELSSCSLRPHLIWGPGDTNLIPRLIARAKSGRLRQVGDGKNLVDTVYVDNAADAHLQAAEALAPGSPVAGSAYFISQGEPVNLWEWVNTILDRLDLPKVTKSMSFKSAYTAGAVMETVYGLLGVASEPLMTRFLALQLARSHYFSIEKARRYFGYSPRVGMDEGLERLAKSLQ